MGGQLRVGAATEFNLHRQMAPTLRGVCWSLARRNERSPAAASECASECS
eukprot:COSAG03_NODE_1948_length_3310_cov_16.778262_4_plen_50_part_00